MGTAPVKLVDPSDGITKVTISNTWMQMRRMEF